MTTFSFGIFSFFLSFFSLSLEFRVHFLRSRFMQFASVPRAPSPTPSHALSLRVRVSCCIYEARTSFCGSPLCAGDFLGRPRPFFLELLVAFSFFFLVFQFFRLPRGGCGCAGFAERTRFMAYAMRRRAASCGRTGGRDRDGGSGSSGGSCAKKAH